MPAQRPYAPCVLAIIASLMLGCGEKKPDPQSDDAATSKESQSQSTEAVQATPGNPITAPLTAEDIGRWGKGIAGEMKAVQDAGVKLKTARTGEDTVNAMMGVQEMNTIAAGARAAGLEQERYKFVRSNYPGLCSTSLRPRAGSTLPCCPRNNATKCGG